MKNLFSLLLVSLLMTACSQSSSNNPESGSQSNSDFSVEISKLQFVGALSADTSNNLLDFGTANPLVSSITKIINLKNDSSAPVDFTLAALTPLSGFTIKTNRCVSPLAGKTTCAITIVFSSRGLYNSNPSDYFIVTVGSSTLSVNLTSKIENQLNPNTSDPSLIYNLSTTSTGKILSVKNNGPGNASNIVISPPAGYVVSISRCGIILKPGQSCLVTLVFNNYRTQAQPTNSVISVAAKGVSNLPITSLSVLDGSVVATPLEKLADNFNTLSMATGTGSRSFHYIGIQLYTPNKNQLVSQVILPVRADSHSPYASELYVQIVPVVNGLPDLNNPIGESNLTLVVNENSIQTSGPTIGSLAKMNFDTPVTLSVGKQYGIVIKFLENDDITVYLVNSTDTQFSHATGFIDYANSWADVVASYAMQILGHEDLNAPLLPPILTAASIVQVGSDLSLSLTSPGPKITEISIGNNYDTPLDTCGSNWQPLSINNGSYNLASLTMPHIQKIGPNYMTVQAKNAAGVSNCITMRNPFYYTLELGIISWLEPSSGNITETNSTYGIEWYLGELTVATVRIFKYNNSNCSGSPLSIDDTGGWQHGSASVSLNSGPNTFKIVTTKNGTSDLVSSPCSNVITH